MFDYQYSSVWGVDSIIKKMHKIIIISILLSFSMDAFGQQIEEINLTGCR